MNQDQNDNLENDNIHCRKATALISKSLDEPLTQREQFLLQTHLSICKACSLFNKQVTLLNKTFKKIPTNAKWDSEPLKGSLSEESMENMQRLIDENNE